MSRQSGLYFLSHSKFRFSELFTKFSMVREAFPLPVITMHVSKYGVNVHVYVGC